MRALVLAAFLGSGCFTPVGDDSCRVDSDCGDAVCTRIGECTSQAYALRIHWTIRGQAANVAGACDGISELEVLVGDPSVAAEHGIRPVPCSSGSFFFDKLPLGYTQVGVSAFGNSGGYLTSARGTSIGAGGAVTLDLRF